MMALVTVDGNDHAIEKLFLGSDNTGRSGEMIVHTVCGITVVREKIAMTGLPILEFGTEPRCPMCQAYTR